MKKITISIGSIVLAAVLVLTFSGPVTRGDDESGPRKFRAELKGRNEVPLALSAGRGDLELTVNEDDSSVHFVLSYEGLRTHVLFAHIHVGQRNVNGGVTIFFCDNTTPPHSPNTCPDNAGTVEGDFKAADVIRLQSQQLDAHDLAKLLRAIRAGQTYANVHTADSPAGEIRGQIKVAED